MAMKLVRDIRYYESEHVPNPETGPPRLSKKLNLIPPAAIQLGQRVACMLYSEGFSVGTYDHIYIAFTTSIPDRQIVLTDYGCEPWHRYVAYGLSSKFQSLTPGRKLDRVEAATFDVLEALRPARIALLTTIRERLRRHGGRTLILRAFEDSKKYRFEVWFDVPPWGETAFLYVRARDNATGIWMEAKPIPLRDHEDAFPLVSSISLIRGVVTIRPRKSFKASLYTRPYRTPIRIPLSRFVERSNDDPYAQPLLK